MESRRSVAPTGMRLDATFAALADPTRRAILARLATGEASVTELARPFAMSQPAISKHLKVLERAGLVSRGRDAQRRPCRIEAKPLAEASGWLEAYRQIWPPDRLVSTESWGGPWPETVNTLTLIEKNGKTTATVMILYPSKDARDAALQTGMKDGMALSYDRLAELVASLSGATK